MKIQIRRGVFETNSSSTHSLTISAKPLKDIQTDIANEMIKFFKTKCEDEEDELYIEDGVLRLEGINIEDGDERQNLYYIIKSWPAKIQYLAMFLKSEEWYLEGFSEDAKAHNYTPYNYSKYDITKNAVYKRFVELVKEYYKAKGYEISAVVNDFQYNTWVEFISDEVNNIIKPNIDLDNEIITVEKIENIFKTVMDDNHTIIYKDIAYNPWNPPTLKIL